MVFFTMMVSVTVAAEVVVVEVQDNVVVDSVDYR
jgi:hypothetical protein